MRNSQRRCNDQIASLVAVHLVEIKPRDFCTFPNSGTEISFSGLRPEVCKRVERKAFARRNGKRKMGISLVRANPVAVKSQRYTSSKTLVHRLPHILNNVDQGLGSQIQAVAVILSRQILRWQGRARTTRHLHLPGFGRMQATREEGIAAWLSFLPRPKDDRHRTSLSALELQFI